MKRGFTLIELLVVIVIIGLLAGIGIASFSGSLARGRDTKRYSDLKEIGDALKRYQLDNGSYPSTGGAWWTICTTGADTTVRTNTGATGWIPNLAPDYVSVLPEDPSGCVGGSYDGYIYVSNGVDYKISGDWTAEVGAECGPGDRFFDPPRGPYNSTIFFCSLYSPGGANW